MVRQTLALFMLAAYSVFTLSCTMGKTTVLGAPELADKAHKHAAIITVVMKDGKVMEFQQSSPARLVAGADAIVGICLQQASIDKREVLSISKSRAMITTVDGRTYKIAPKTFTDSGDKVHFSYRGWITIPLSDIQQVWVGEANTDRVVANISLVFVAIVGVATVGLVGEG